MDNWAEQLRHLLAQQPIVIMVTVAQVKGSTPREVGAKLLLTRQQNKVVIQGTIGGGNLEYKAIAIAQNMLENPRHASPSLQFFSLAAGLGMCCGGVVELLFERIEAKSSGWLSQWLQFSPNTNACLITTMSQQQINKSIIFDSSYHRTELMKQGNQLLFIETVQAPRPELLLFGAGHVGQALIRILSDFALNIKWVDSRDDCLDDEKINALPCQVNLVISDRPEVEIAQAKPNSCFLLMTHDHRLDLQLTEHILKRDDFCYFGLIGSATKRARFEHRLQAKKITTQQLEKMICPIGISGMNNKSPASIALAVAAQLMLHIESQKSDKVTNQTQQGVA